MGLLGCGDDDGPRWWAGAATVWGMSEFSVIIPTLQRAKELRELVEMCAAHPRVLEVLVINNAPEPLHWASPKVRVLQQAENIYVNPAWNLGAREARGKYLAILNDDVLFDTDVFGYAARLLASGRFGMVGPAPRAFTGLPGLRPRHRMATDYSLRRGFGACMMLCREDYVQIPSSIKVWGGDNWLLLQQDRPSAEVLGFRFKTDMSTTAGSPEFQEFRQREAEASFELLAPLIGTKPWHSKAGRADRGRSFEHRLALKACRVGARLRLHPAR